VRLSVTLIRDGTVRSATELAKRLATDSKLEELRGVLVRQFLDNLRRFETGEPLRDRVI